NLHCFDVGHHGPLTTGAYSPRSGERRQAMHNDTPLSTAMYFKELDRKLTPRRPTEMMVYRRILEATGSVFHHIGELHGKIQTCLGIQGKESLTDVASRSQLVKGAR